MVLGALLKLLTIRAANVEIHGGYYSLSVVKHTKSLLKSGSCLEHFLRIFNLVIGVPLLLSDHITQQDFIDAKTYLDKFLINFCELYGEKQCGFNFHLITHFVEKVEYLGPLWGTSLFFSLFMKDSTQLY